MLKGEDGMYLDAVKSIVATETRKYDGVSRKTDTKNDVATEKKFDKTFLSSEARKAMETSADVKVISTVVAAQPDIRQDKVDEVRQKMNDGYYGTKEFADNLAGRLTKEFGF
jgi:anti-sigma28 factor (negative regulator of flagellin synthesis)